MFLVGGENLLAIGTFKGGTKVQSPLSHKCCNTGLELRKQGKLPRGGGNASDGGHLGYGLALRFMVRT